MNNRYRYDTGCIIDQEDNKVLSTKQVVNRLNKQNKLLTVKKKQLEAIAKLFEEEIENADGDLKKELIRISKIELKI